jgi:hypothetical protein
VNVSPEELPVYVEGRWGRRRVCVTECAATLTSEDVYSFFSESGLALRPGVRGRLRFTVAGMGEPIDFEVRPNLVWRRGRVFLRCTHCRRRCTRLYMPCLEDPLRCRQCWRLTYESAQSHNYRGSGLFSSRMASVMNTFYRREERRSQSLARWEKRRMLREARKGSEEAR